MSRRAAVTPAQVLDLPCSPHRSSRVMSRAHQVGSYVPRSDQEDRDPVPASVGRPAASTERGTPEMTITAPNLIRLGGFSALLAGICYILVGIFHPANVPAAVTTTRWELVHVVACAMSFFG